MRTSTLECISRGLRILLLLFPILAHAQPVADFSASTRTGCQTVVTNFTDLSTGNPVSWNWTFIRSGIVVGSLNGQNPGRIFAQPGCYDVRLIVTDNLGRRDTLTRTCYIEVFRSPVPDFSVDTLRGCVPATLNFSNLTQANAAGGLNGCTWVFRNRRTFTSFSNTDLNPQVTFTDYGGYDVQLRCTNSNGCDSILIRNNYLSILPTPEASFTVSGNTACTFPVNVTYISTGQSFGAPVVNYEWQFPGGTPASFNGLTPPPVSYATGGNYQIRLRAFTPEGCEDTNVQNVAVGIQTFASDFSLSDSTPCLNQNVTFTRSTPIPGGGTTTWNLGNGGPPLTGSPVSGSYTTLGTFTASMTVQTSLGCIATVQKTLRSLPLPVPAFSVNPDSTCNVNQPFTFTDLTPGALGWNWDFGDGNGSTQQNPVHAYAQEGAYRVCLTATDANGCAATICVDSALRINTPTANFQALVTSACVPFTTTFTDNTVSSEPVVQWLWKFDDGSGTNVTPGFSTQSSPTVTVLNAGKYDVTLYVRTTSGCTDSTTYFQYLNGGVLPNAQFSVDKVLACINERLIFQAAVKIPGFFYFWDFRYPGGGFNLLGDSIPFSYADTGCFNIALVVDYNGCQDTVVQNKLVCISPPKAEFDVLPTAICGTPATLSIVNRSLGPISTYSWAVNGVTVSNSPALTSIPIPPNAPPGNYRIRLLVEHGPSGCRDSAVQVVQVGNPIADFQVNNPTGCRRHTLSITNNSQNLSRYLWDFGDGSGLISAGATPAHVYADTGTYSISLIVEDQFGCRDTLSRPNALRVNGAFAGFDASPQAGCRPLGVQFNATATASFGASITNWSWRFGDGNTGSGANPLHTYQNDGSYSVTQVVTDNNGCRDSLTRTNYINVQQPFAAFTASKLLVCEGETINFQSQATGANLSYLWRFGSAPGDTSTQANPFWAYQDSGFQTVTLIVRDGSGCVDSITRVNYIYVEGLFVDFDASPRLGTCPPLDVQFSDRSIGRISRVQWEFGDGTFSAQRNPRHIYLQSGCFDVTLRIFHPNGCVKTLTKPCFVNISGPRSTVTFDPPLACMGDTVTFTVALDSATLVILDPDDVPLQQVNFGVNRSDTITFRHVYNSPGTYFPRVQVIDARGCRVTISPQSAIRIKARPRALINAPFATGCTPFAASLSDTTTPGDTTLRSWIWRFGDGAGGAGPQQSHTYTTPGTYTVSLVVTDNYGCVDSTTLPITTNPRPRADFGVNTTFTCAPATLRFNDLSSGTTITDWKWKFGTGDSLTGVQNPAYVYRNEGLYSVSLIATDLNGCSDTLTRPNYIRVRRPTAAIYSDQEAACTPGAITFYADSSVVLSDTTLDTYIWVLQIPGGIRPPVIGPVRSPADSIRQSYNRPGVYVASLVVADIFGCRDTAFKSIQIHRLPSARIMASALSGCTPFSPSFTDASLPGDAPVSAWQWDFGNGDNSSLQNPSTTYALPGAYTVSLQVQDANGCVHDTTLDVEALRLPIADFVASDSFNCAPIDIRFDDRSRVTTIANWDWDFGDGNTQGGSPNPVHRYTANGSYDVSLSVTDVNGCQASFVKPQYIRLRRPTAYLYADNPNGCNPVRIELFADSARVLSDTTLARFFWLIETPGGFRPVVSTSDTTSQVYTQGGSFDVTLVVEDIFGCRDTVTRADYLNISQRTIPDPLAIEWVSVVSGDEIEINYQASPLPATEFNQYLIFWQNPASGLYVLADSIKNINTLRYVHRSPRLRPEQQVNCYKVIPQNSCRENAIIDNSLPHCTILLDASPRNDTIRLDWTPYVGWTPAFYEVYKTGSYNPLSGQMIATVPGTQLFYLDGDMFCTDSVTYRVRAVREPGGTARSFSNIDGTAPFHPKPTEVVNVIYASVERDSFNQVVWLPYGGYQPRMHYIERSLDGINWRLIDSAGVNDLFYNDFDVNVDERFYYYRVQVEDVCDDRNPYGAYGRTILLSVKQEGKYPLLSWTPYGEWPAGVQSYEIELFDPQLNAWRVVGRTGSTVRSFLDDRSYLNEGEYCYRVRAVEAGGLRSASLSNEDCTIFGPQAFAPNAFSPNDDGYNDRFTIVTPGVRFATLRIYNRWGKLIFETNDPQSGWDGRVDGGSAPEGVYVYRLEAEGTNGRPYEISGTVTLIR